MAQHHRTAQPQNDQTDGSARPPLENHTRNGRAHDLFCPCAEAGALDSANISNLAAVANLKFSRPFLPQNTHGFGPLRFRADTHL